MPSPRDRSRSRPRPPVPSHPPQPAPPTGEPITAPRARTRPGANPRTATGGEATRGEATRGTGRDARKAGKKAPSGSPDATHPQSPDATHPEPGTAHPQSTGGAARREAAGAAHPADSIRPPHHPAPPPPDLPPSPAAPPAPDFPPPAGRTPLSARTVAAAACLVLGVGLLGGAGAGAWLSDDDGGPSGGKGFEPARAAWHEVPVDELFPRTLKGKAAGPGGADRRWTRVAVAPDSGCAHAFDPTLAKALSPVGCNRLLRATYADETTSSVTTVGLLFTKGDQEAMRGLRKRFAVENLGERTDLMPRPYAARGTVAADFGDAQRASWTVRVLSDAPVVVYAVSGFADGRVVTDPQAAADATRKGETSAPAQAGLGHDAQGIADRVERGLRRSAVDGDEKKGDDR
ncbi:hypothetical protein GCM10009801_76390 [Streptomyces albiaxialis]|uniref:Uncharacterized protein n=1 Tax=Streptomyces albiaxialis TaxID=329523 RepID=A0ABN2X3D7_9ACTN